MRLKTIIGAAALCALCISAVAASSATAGPTWYTCMEVATNTGGFYDDHCKTTSGTTHDWSTVELEPGKLTPVESFQDAGSEFTLSATLSGVKVKIVCSTLSSSGELENSGSNAVGQKFVSSFSGCAVTEPKEKNCTVNEPITTKSLKVAGTMPKETENKVTFSPESGEEYATVTIANCTTSALNGPKPVKGSAAGVGTEADGSLLEFTEGSSSLTLGGQAAKFTGKARTVEKGKTNTVALETP